MYCTYAYDKHFKYTLYLSLYPSPNRVFRKSGEPTQRNCPEVIMAFRSNVTIKQIRVYLLDELCTMSICTMKLYSYCIDEQYYNKLHMRVLVTTC